MIDIVDQIGMFNGMARKRMMQYKEKYLISSGSSLEYYKCNNDTNFKVEFEYIANLDSLRQKDNIKVKKEKKESIDYSNIFNSDSE
jgi:hypothetical protein